VEFRIYEQNVACAAFQHFHPRAFEPIRRAVAARTPVLQRGSHHTTKSPGNMTNFRNFARQRRAGNHLFRLWQHKCAKGDATPGLCVVRDALVAPGATVPESIGRGMPPFREGLPDAVDAHPSGPVCESVPCGDTDDPHSER
jgi:hypothetical protein